MIDSASSPPASRSGAIARAIWWAQAGVTWSTTSSGTGGMPSTRSVARLGSSAERSSSARPSSGRRLASLSRQMAKMPSAGPSFRMRGTPGVARMARTPSNTTTIVCSNPSTSRATAARSSRSASSSFTRWSRVTRSLPIMASG
jgi:hypothetical protein